MSDEYDRTYPRMLNGETPYARLLHGSKSVYELPAATTPPNDVVVKLGDRTSLGKPSADANKIIVVSKFERNANGGIDEVGSKIPAIESRSSTFSDDQNRTVKSAISNCSIGVLVHLVFGMLVQQAHETTFVCMTKSTALLFKKAIETSLTDTNAHLAANNVDGVTEVQMDVDFETSGKSFKYHYSINDSESTFTLYYLDRSDL